MTTSGENMLRMKAAVAVGPGSRRTWRNSRANNLAKMIAWHRRHRHSANEPLLRRIVLEDIVPDIGWPTLSWVKERVREAERELARNLGGARRG